MDDGVMEKNQTESLLCGKGWGLTIFIDVTAEGEAAGVWHVLTALQGLGPAALRAYEEIFLKRKK